MNKANLYLHQAPPSDPLPENSLHGKMTYTLMNDFLAKYSLQNNYYALAGLLAALLRIPVESITSIECLNPIQPGDKIDDKLCILDIRLEINGEKIIDIEIQTQHQPFWPERSITYLCRNFDHLKHGENYDMIRPCVQIGILEKNLFRKDDPRYTDQFLSEYRLLNTCSHTEYCGKFEIRVLLLSQIENATEADRLKPNGLYHWAKLFKASSWEELAMEAKDNPRIHSLVGTIKELSEEEKIAELCEQRRRYSIEVATYEYLVEKAQQERDGIALERDEIALERDEIALERDEIALERDNALAREKDALAREENLLARIAELEAMSVQQK